MTTTRRLSALLLTVRAVRGQLDAVEAELVRLAAEASKAPSNCPPEIWCIAKLSADEFGSDPHLILAEARPSRVIDARFAAYYAGAKSLGLNTYRLATMFRKHHKTILHGLRVCGNRMDTEPLYRGKVEALVAKVRAALAKAKAQ